MEANDETGDLLEMGDSSDSLQDDSDDRKSFRRRSKFEEIQATSEQQSDTVVPPNRGQLSPSQSTQANHPEAESQSLDASLPQTKTPEEGSRVRMSFMVDKNEAARGLLTANMLSAPDYSGFDKVVAESTERYEIAREKIIEIAESDLNQAYHSLLNSFDSILKEKIELDARFVEKHRAYEGAGAYSLALEQEISDFKKQIEDLKNNSIKLRTDIDGRDSHILEQEEEIEELRQRLSNRPFISTIEPGFSYNDFQLLEEENEALRAAKALYLEDLMSQDEKRQREFDTITRFIETAAAGEACLTKEISYATASTLGKTVQDHYEAFFDNNGHPTDLALAVYILWRKRSLPNMDRFVKNVLFPEDKFSQSQSQEAEGTNLIVLGPDDRDELRHTIRQQEYSYLLDELHNATFEPQSQKSPSYLDPEASLADVDELQTVTDAIPVDMQPTVNMNHPATPSQNIREQPISLQDEAPKLDKKNEVLDINPSLALRPTPNTSEVDNGQSKEQAERIIYKPIVDTFSGTAVFSTKDPELRLPSSSFPLNGHEAWNGLTARNDDKMSETGFDLSSKDRSPQMTVFDAILPRNELYGQAYETSYLPLQVPNPSISVRVSRAHSPVSAATTEFSGSTKLDDTSREPSLAHSTSTGSEHHPSSPSSLYSTELIKILSTSSRDSDDLLKPEHYETYSTLFKRTGLDENDSISPVAQLSTSQGASEQPERKFMPESKDDLEESAVSTEQEPSVDRSSLQRIAAVTPRNVLEPSLNVPRVTDPYNVNLSSEQDQKPLHQKPSPRRRSSESVPRSSIKKHTEFDENIPEPFIASTRPYGLGITPMSEIVMSAVTATPEGNKARKEEVHEAVQVLNSSQPKASSSESVQTGSSTNSTNSTTSKHLIDPEIPFDVSDQAEQQAVERYPLINDNPDIQTGLGQQKLSSISVVKARASQDSQEQMQELGDAQKGDLRGEPIKSVVKRKPSLRNHDIATQSYTKGKTQPDLGIIVEPRGATPISARRTSEESTTKHPVNTQAGHVATTDRPPQGKSLPLDAKPLGEQSVSSVSSSITGRPSIGASPKSISKPSPISRSPDSRKDFKKSSIDGRVMLPDIRTPPTPYGKSPSITGSDTLSHRLSTEISRWTGIWSLPEPIGHDRGEENLEYISTSEAQLAMTKRISTQNAERNSKDFGDAGDSTVRVAETGSQQPAISQPLDTDKSKGIPAVSLDTVMVRSNNVLSSGVGVSSAVSSPVSHASPGLRKRRESKSPTTTSCSPSSDDRTCVSTFDAKEQHTEHTNGTRDIREANSLWLTIILVVVISSMVIWYRVLQVMSSLFSLKITFRRVLIVWVSAVQCRVGRMLRSINRHFSEWVNSLSNSLSIQALTLPKTNLSWRTIFVRAVPFLCWSMSVWFLLATYKLRTEWDYGNSVRARRVVPKWNSEVWEFSPMAHLENAFIRYYIQPLTDFT